MTVDLKQLDAQLAQLAAECKRIGTPFTIRQRLRAAQRVLPVIAEARMK